MKSKRITVEDLRVEAEAPEEAEEGDGEDGAPNCHCWAAFRARSAKNWLGAGAANSAEETVPSGLSCTRTLMRTVPWMVERDFSETCGRTLRMIDRDAGFTLAGACVTSAAEGGGAAGADGVVLREETDGLGDSDFGDGLFLLMCEFLVAEFSSGEFLGDAGAEFVFEFAAFAELEDGDGLVLPAAEWFSAGVEEALELAELGAAGLDERRIRRGTKMMARMTAAAALTRKSLFERGCGLGEITRRALPMVALTCGSEVTGIGAREGCGVTLREALGETGESGTARGSISGSGWR